MSPAPAILPPTPPNPNRDKWINRAIIALILAITLPVVIILYPAFFPPAHPKEKINSTKASLTNLSAILQDFKLNYGRFPTTAESLDILLQPQSNPARSTPYLKRMPLDGWGNPFLYTRPSPTTFTLYSPGPDGIPNTADDLTPPSP